MRQARHSGRKVGQVGLSWLARDKKLSSRDKGSTTIVFDRPDDRQSSDIQPNAIAILVVENRSQLLEGRKVARRVGSVRSSSIKKP